MDRSKTDKTVSFLFLSFPFSFSFFSFISLYVLNRCSYRCDRCYAFVLRIEAVGPAPAGYEVGFVGLECSGEGFDVFLGSDGFGAGGAGEQEVRCDPGEIERGEGSEQVAAVDGRSEEHTSELQSLRHLVC